MSHEGYYGADGGGRSTQEQQQSRQHDSAFGAGGGPNDMTAGMPRISVPIQDAYMGDGDGTPGGPGARGGGGAAAGAAGQRRGSGSPGLSFSLNGDYGSSNSLHSSSSALDLSQASTFDIVKEARKVIRAFLLEHQCYELIKNSGKVVVFDVKIPINLAFFAMVEHDIKSVPIWDADQAQFVGMFTATDFVNILRHFYIRGSPMNELAEHSIASWRAIPRSLSMSPQREGMIAITPEDSLYEACKLLRDNRLHRLPVLDPIQNSVLSVITHSGILEYLVATFREQRRLFDQPIFDLGIGVYSNLITVPEDMPLVRVLHTLVERRVSALPIVDSSGMVVNIYCVSNVTELVKDRSLTQLDMPVGDILRIQAAEGNIGEGLHLCYKTDTLHMIFERFAAVKAHRLVCVDEYTRCVGIVSLSDLFNYFIQE